jgi:membrane-bound serine protease (ClpP class)
MDFWYWVLIFLGLSIFFAVLEIFIPSGGILAFLSVTTLFASMVLAFQCSPLFGGIYLFGVSIGIPIFLWFAFKIWPQTVMGRRILLQPEDDPALQPDLELIALKQLVGKQGVARSKMMLSGLIEIEGKRINAISESEPLESGDAIVVTSVDGINILVRKINPPANTPQNTTTTKTEQEPTIDDPFA